MRRVLFIPLAVGAVLYGLALAVAAAVEALLWKWGLR